MSRAGAAQGGGCSQCRSQVISARRDCPATKQGVATNSSRITCLSPKCVADPLTTRTLKFLRDERIRERLKAFTMSFRPTTFVVVTTGLIAAAGLTGCQVPRSVRSFELQSFSWRRMPQSHPRHEEDRTDSETYVPESVDVSNSIPQPTYPQPTVPDQPKLRLPPEPTFPSDPATNLRPIPVPPAVEVGAPQARRWKPSQPNRPAAQGPQYTSQSESSVEDFDLPPARVTYNNETTTEEPATTPAPEPSSASQPQLFRPAGSAKNMFETMKRKLSR